MKKKVKNLTISAFIVFALIPRLSAQKIEDKSHNTIGYITDSGTVKGRSHNTIGYITDNGTVKGRSHNTIGYITDNGTVKADPTIQSGISQIAEQ